MDISHIANCNKVKQMKLKDAVAEIAAAIKGSSTVEVDETGKRIRRTAGKEVPALSSSKKRDQKAAEKEEGKQEETKKEVEDKLPELDARGNPIFTNSDFENPIIIHFQTKQTADGFKVNWKDVETAVRKEFPRLKIVYSRSDPFEGDLAISSHRVNNVELEKLSKATLKAQDREFTFTKTAGDELKTFW